MSVPPGPIGRFWERTWFVIVPFMGLVALASPIMFFLGFGGDVYEKNKDRVLQEARFDSSVISKLPQYRALHSFLDSNIATIFAYRSRNQSSTEGENDGRRSPEDCTCETFSDLDALYSDTTDRIARYLPHSLQTRFKELCQAIGKENLFRLRICNDGTIHLEARADSYFVGEALFDKDSELYANHTLIWGAKVDWGNLEIASKDTLLEDCIYHVGLTIGYAWN